MKRNGITSEQWRLLLTSACLVSLVGWWAGCGSPEQRYQMLSFFFDGVPDPNAPLGVDSEGNPRFRMEHKPYAEERCSECHGQAGISGMSLGNFSRVDSRICMKCHEEQTALHPYMHGPVAAGACLWCHDPHDSSYLHLLKQAPHKLCSQCHDQTLLEPSVSEHAMVDVDCIECHSGHGGTNPYFLIARPRPAEDEADSQAGEDDPDVAGDDGTEPDTHAQPTDETGPAQEPRDREALQSDGQQACRSGVMESLFCFGWLPLQRGTQ